MIVAAAAVPAAAGPADAPWDGAVFAGATAPHPANITANPAAMLLITPGTHVFLGATGTLDRLAIERQVIDDGGGDQPGPSVRSGTMGAGGHVGVIRAWPGGMVAFTAGTPPPEETIAGEEALAYHSRGNRTRQKDWGTIAAGYRVTSRLSLGLAGSYGTRSSVVRFARDTALESGRDPARGVGSDCGGVRCGLEHPAAAELWSIDVASDNTSIDDLSLSGGILVRLPGELWLGLSYQRPWNLGRIERSGVATVVGAPRDGAVVRRGESTLFDRLPEVVRVGARSRPRDRWDVVGELRWRRLGRIGADDVRVYGGDLAAGDTPAIYPRPRGLHDAVALEVGIEEVDDGQRLRLGARVGADSGAVAGEQMSARAPWGRQLTAGGGLQLRLGSRWVVQAAYGVGFQPTVTADPSAFDPIDRLDCVDSGFDVELAACDTVRGGYGAPTAAGAYGRWSHVGSLSLRVEVP